MGIMVFSIRSDVSALNFALVSVISKCLGPFTSAVMKGRFMLVVVTLESSIFAFSAASLSLCSALLSAFKSIPFSF